MIRSFLGIFFAKGPKLPVTSLSEVRSEIESLWKEKRYLEALDKVDLAQEEHPEFAKMAVRYRGKISMDLLKHESKDLPKFRY